MNSAVGARRALGDVADRRRHGGLVVRIALERDDLAPLRRANRLLEGRFDHRAVGIVGNQRGVGALAHRTGILNDAVDVGFRQKAQQVDAIRGDVGVGRKGDHRHIARPRHLRDEADRLREQRSEDDLGAVIERLLGGVLRGLRRCRRRPSPGAGCSDH